MADPVLKITGDTEKAQQSIVALEKRIDKLQHSLKHVSEQSRKAGKTGEQAFGASAASNVLQYASGFLSLVTVVQAANRALEYNRQLQKDAGQNTKDALSGVAKLSQLAAESADPQGKLAGLIASAQGIYKQGVGKNLNEAADFIFAMESTNVPAADRGLVTRLAAHETISDPSGFVESLKSLQVAVGQQETGSLRDIVSKAFSASSFAAAPADALLGAAATAGPGAGALRIRDEELLASLAITSNASSADVAGTQMKALFQSLQNQGGFTGVPLREIVNQIDSQGMGDKELNKFFGSSESVQAFRLLRQNMEDYSKALNSIDTAASRKIADQVANLPLLNPTTAAPILQKQTEASLEIERTSIGLMENLANAMQDEVVRNMEAGPGGQWVGWATQQSADWQRWFYGNNAFLSDPRNQQSLTEANPELFNQIATTLKDIKRQGEEQLKEQREQLKEQRQQRGQRIPRRGE